MCNKYADFFNFDTNFLHNPLRIYSSIKFIFIILLDRKAESLYILIVRISGFIELIRYDESDLNSISFHQIIATRIHITPVTSISYFDNYLITSSQGNMFKILQLGIVNDELGIEIAKTEQIRSEITTICIQGTTAAIGTKDGLIYLWNLKFSRSEYCLTRKNKSTSNLRKAINKLIIVKSYVISLNENHQMCIWDRTRGQLMKEFTFFTPNLSKNSFFKNIIPNDLFNFLTFFSSFFNSNCLNDSKNLLNEMYINQPSSTMCLYSRNLLITGGCSCIFIWNINNGGELVKKINLIKPMSTVFDRKKQLSNETDKYSQKHYVKQIDLITQTNSSEQLSRKGLSTKQKVKLLLITDYNDSIYLLKIPPNIIQELD